MCIYPTKAGVVHNKKLPTRNNRIKGNNSGSSGSDNGSGNSATDGATTTDEVSCLFVYF